MQPNSPYPSEPSGHVPDGSPVVSALERIVDERMEEGLERLREQAAGLMRQIAAEMWREAGGDVRDEQERILSFITRDQAIRSLIAHSDDRFQALAVRAERLEDTLALLAQTTRATQEAVRRGTDALREAAGAITIDGLDELKHRLEEVERNLVLAREGLDERDRALIEALDQQVRESGKLIQHETGRIVEALEGYVQGGLGVMGKMAQRIEEQNARLAEQAELVEAKIQGAVERAAAQVSPETVTRVIENRLMGLAQLVRSDSEALRREVDRVAAQQAEELHAELDRRVGQIAGATAASVEHALSSFGAQIDATIERVSADLDLATERMTDRIEAGAERLGRAVASMEDRPNAVAEAAGRAETTAAVAAAAAARAAEAGEGLQASIEGIVTRVVEDKLAGLARLIRSDNEVLGSRLDQEQETAKQTLRAIKELQSGLPDQMRMELERRFETFGERLHRETQATAEAIAKANERLGRQVDRAVSAVTEGQQDELQTVIERMGDAMHALATVGRPARPSPPEASGGASANRGPVTRIEVD
jgi:hypothetical protein